jgi:3-deoxy-D-manno-octulosonic-acid transferase
LIQCGAYLYSLWSHIDKKAQDFFQLRKNQIIPRRKSEKDFILWMHCASVGEYEQGFPLLEYIRSRKPDTRIFVSFFSASAQNIHIESSVVDETFYLPIDTQQNALLVINSIKPDVVIWVKYEFWKNILTTLSKNKIPLYLISAHFPRNSYYFRWPMRLFYKKIFATFNQIFLQDNQDLLQMKEYNSILSGDTRYNKVVSNKNTTWNDKNIENFCRGSRVMIAGSVWKEDEKIFKDLLSTSIKLIWVPHELNAAHHFFTNIKSKCYYSQGVDPACQILILDQVGILKYIYRIADYAYIGGGFGKGIHNILESLVYGIPTLIGPNHARFLEAEEWKTQGYVQVIDQNRSLMECIAHWESNPIDPVLIQDQVSSKAIDLRIMTSHMGIS